MAALILAGTVATPLVTSLRGEDHFRAPKDLLLVGLAIVAGAVFAIALLLRKLKWPAELRLPLLLAAAALGWALVSTAASTNRALSVRALVWGAAVGGLFLMAAFALRHVAPVVLAIAILIPGAINAVLLLLQASKVWNPWTFEPGMPERLMRNALLGNPNDVGAYLAAVTLFAVAMFVATRRWPYAIFTALTTAALLATETLTAIAALAVALVVMAIVARSRAGVAVGLIAPLVVVASLFLYAPTRARFRDAERTVRAGAWGEVLTGRLPAFLEAWELFRDHPLLGAGPGTFRYHYMPYFARIEERYPHVVVDVPEGGTIFAQTHNDHLQLLAETGLPGYLLVIGGIGVLAVRTSRRGRGLSRLLAAPTAALLFVLMLASFPLQLAAPAWTCIAMGGACLAWSDDAA